MHRLRCGSLAAVFMLAVGGQAFFGAEVKRHRYIAVLPLTNLRPGTDTDWVGVGAAESLTEKLADVPGLATVGRVQIKEVVEEQGFQAAMTVDQARKVGRLVGADRIVIGTFSEDRGAILFNVRVVDVATGVVLNTASLRTARSKVFDALFHLADAVIRSFDRKAMVVNGKPVAGEAPPTDRVVLTAEQQRKLKDCGSTNVDAYEACAKGIDAEDPDEKVRWYTTAIALDSNYASAYNNRGVVHEDRGEHDQAIRDYGRAIKLNPHLAQAYNNRGNAWDHKGEHDRAIRDYDRAIELKPDYANAYYNRGSAYVKKGEYDRAIRDYDRAIKLNPNDAKACYNRGIAYREKGDNDRAIRDCDRAIELKPDFADAHNNRAVAYAEKGEYDRAIHDYDRAIKLKPDCAKAYNNRGVAYQRKGEHDRAIRDFGRAIELKPDFAEAYANRGGAYLVMRELEQAMRDLDRAIELKPDYASAYNNRAVAHYLKHNYNRAWEDVRKCRALGGTPNPRFLRLLRKASGPQV